MFVILLFLSVIFYVIKIETGRTVNQDVKESFSSVNVNPWRRSEISDCLVNFMALKLMMSIFCLTLALSVFVTGLIYLTHFSHNFGSN